jgi:hypothetical protein
MLPATLYLLGFLFIIFIWVKFAIARRIFLFRQVLSLSLCGCLDFIMATVSVHLPQSAVLGDLSSLVCLFQLYAVYTFLPPHVTLPGSIDRAVAAFFTSSLVLNVLASIRVTSNKDGDSVLYAEAVCLLCFYLSCLCASQFSRFFAIVDFESGNFRLAPLMSPFTTAAYLLSLSLFIIQAAIAISRPTSFATTMAASMSSALGYLCLVATFVLVHQPEGSFDWDAVKADPKEIDEAEKDVPKEHPEEQETAKVAANSAFRKAGAERPVQTRRSRLASSAVESERGSVVWCPSGSARPAGPQSDQERQTYRSNRNQSGLSISSWGRIEQLMNRATKGHHIRTTSGATFYGSESSYQGAPTVRTSMMSSFAQAVTGNGHSDVVPPVPAIDPRYLQSTSQIELGFAKPLTNGEAPIPLQGPKKTLLSSPSGVIETPQSGFRGALSALSSLLHSFDSSQAHQMSTKNSQSMTTLVPIHSRESPTNLPARYQSSKLFPTAEWEAKDVDQDADVLMQGLNSPNDSEVKHTMHHARPRNPSAITKQDSTSDGMAQHSPGRKKKTVCRENLAEDPKASMTASIMFPRY